MTIRPALTALTAFTALAAPAAALACGGVFPPIESTSGAAFEAQTVLIHRRSDAVDLHVRMTVAPGDPTFSWILPAPRGAELSLGDDALFDALDAISRPVVTITRDTSGGLCGAADAGGGVGDRLDVIEVGRIGEYDYAIIASGDAAAAARWLTDNGFAVPDGAASAMQPYADAGMDFIGVRLARPGDDLDGSTRPTPLVLTMADATGDLPRYPLGLSRVSAGPVLPVLVYVLGPARAAVQDAETATVVDIADRIRAQSYLEYADAIDEAQAEVDGPLWITDAVVLDPAEQDPALALGPAESHAVLTRLSARLPAERIADVALTWHPDATAAIDPYQSRHIGNDDDDSCRAAGGPVGPPWMVVLLLGLTRLRRRRGTIR